MEALAETDNQNTRNTSLYCCILRSFQTIKDFSFFCLWLTSLPPLYPPQILYCEVIYAFEKTCPADYWYTIQPHIPMFLSLDLDPSKSGGLASKHDKVGSKFCLGMIVGLRGSFTL